MNKYLRVALGGGILVAALGAIGLGSKLITAKQTENDEVATPATEEGSESSDEDGSSSEESISVKRNSTPLTEDIFDWDYNRKGVLEGNYADTSEEDKEFFFGTPESITDDIPEIDNVVSQEFDFNNSQAGNLATQYFTKSNWNTVGAVASNWNDLSFQEKVAKVEQDCATIKAKTLA